MRRGIRGGSRESKVWKKSRGEKRFCAYDTLFRRNIIGSNNSSMKRIKIRGVLLHLSLPPPPQGLPSRNPSDRKRSRWNFRFCSLVQSELYGLIRANGSNASFFYTSSENTTTKERPGFHEQPWRMCDKILQGYVTNDNNQGSPSTRRAVRRPPRKSFVPHLMRIRGNARREIFRKFKS